MDTDPNMRLRIKEAADTFEGSNADIARLVGVSRAAISGWISGSIKTLKAQNLNRFCEVTGYSQDYILYGAGAPLASAVRDVAGGYSTIDVAMNDNEATLLRRFRRMPVDYQSALLGLLGLERHYLEPSDPKRLREFQAQLIGLREPASELLVTVRA